MVADLNALGAWGTSRAASVIIGDEIIITGGQTWNFYSQNTMTIFNTNTT